MESDINYFFILDLPKETQEKELSNFFSLCKIFSYKN